MNNDFREMAKILRKSADIADRIQEVLDDDTLGTREREEKYDALMAELVVQMMKIQKL